VPHLRCRIDNESRCRSRCVSSGPRAIGGCPVARASRIATSDGRGKAVVQVLPLSRHRGGEQRSGWLRQNVSDYPPSPHGLVTVRSPHSPQDGRGPSVCQADPRNPSRQTARWVGPSRLATIHAVRGGRVAWIETYLAAWGNSATTPPAGPVVDPRTVGTRGPATALLNERDKSGNSTSAGISGMPVLLAGPPPDQ